MNKIIKFLTSKWPIIVIVLIDLLLLATNYKSGTWLVGWDSTLPEINFKLNLSRILNATWQEYRGLGAVDNMAHAANIVHFIYAWVLSLILPKNLIRYVFVLIMHAIGGAGAYNLIRYLGKNKPTSKLISLTGAIFYMLNPATIQMFYAPLELFIIHFGFLPWLLLSLIRYLDKSNKKNLVKFVLISLLSVSQAHVPTIFIAYLLAIFAVIVTKFKKNKIGPILKALLATLIINAFWLLPYLYSLGNSSVITNSKINRLSNQEIVMRNDSFGDTKSLALLRGFSLDFEDWQQGNEFGYQMQAWRDHLFSGYSELIGWLIFTIALFGLLVSLKNKKARPFIIMFLIAWITLGSRVPIFASINSLLRQLPLYEAAFRFAFTKFAILYALSFSFLLAAGLVSLKKYLKYLPLIVLTLAFYLSIPAFKGEFLYGKLKLDIPKQYFETFNFFNQQDPSQRIAILPQPTFWNWENNSWGYRGSGFIWQGISQPTLHRSFDPWSQYNETYYLEIERALALSDKEILSQVFDKYNVSWILIDKSIMVPGAWEEVNDYQISEILVKELATKVHSFNNIEIYKLNNAKNIVAPTNVNKVGIDYTYSPIDAAYKNQSNYLVTKDFNVSYPFSNLIALNENISLDLNNITLKSAIELTKDQNLLIPPLVSDNTKVPTLVFVSKTDDFVTVSIQVKTPSLYVNNGEIFKQTATEITTNINSLKESIDHLLLDNLLFDVPSDLGDKSVFVGYFPLASDKIRLRLGKELLSDNQEQVHTRVISETSININLPNELKQGFEANLPKGQNTLTIVLPNIVSQYSVLEQSIQETKDNCDALDRGETKIQAIETGFIYQAKDGGISCDFFRHFRLSGFNGYVLNLEGENISGLPLKAYLNNFGSRKMDLETYLPEGEFNTSYFVFPTSQKGYSLNLETKSYQGLESINSLKKAKLIPIPINWLVNIQIKSGKFDNLNSVTINSSKRLASWNYGSELVSLETDGVINLTESYDPGWQAFAFENANQINQLFPWFFGEKLDHVKINSWSNGWLVPEGEYGLVIVFWPQYLQYFGFVVLLFGIIHLVKYKT